MELWYTEDPTVGHEEALCINENQCRPLKDTITSRILTCPFKDTDEMNKQRYDATMNESQDASVMDIAYDRLVKIWQLTTTHSKNPRLDLAARSAPHKSRIVWVKLKTSSLLRAHDITKPCNREKWMKNLIFTKELATSIRTDELTF